MYLAFMRNSKIIKNSSFENLKPLKAVASPVRLMILDYLKHPADHFPPQVDGNFKTDGVCADFIREKLDIAAATASRHLTLLTEAGLLVAKRKKGWTFYRRDEAAIQRFTQQLQSRL
jgi:DNA-binding transcriptional ArsR family regulator